MWGRFSILARVSALALFVVTASAQDSLNVRQVGFLSIHWEAAFSVAVVDTLAFVATGVTGLRIVNIADPAHPVEIGYYDTPGEGFGVAVSGNYAYVADGGSGLRVVNITNPAAPTEVGHCDTPGYAWCVAVSGNYAYVASDGLRVVDITNPAAPSEVGYYEPGDALGVAVSGNYAYVATGDRGLRVVNVTNPSAPFEVGFYDTPGHACGVAVSGSYAYVADGLYFGIYDCSAATGVSEASILHPSSFILHPFLFSQSVQSDNADYV